MKNGLLFLLFACLISCQEKGSVKIGLEGKPLPSFNLLLIDSSTKFNTTDIPAGEPIVLLYFSPNCHFCKDQTEEIVKNMRSFSNVRFYILTAYPFRELKKYYDQFQLKNYPNVTVGRDYKAYFRNYFKPPIIPYIAIYTKEKNLKQVFVGKVDANLIKDVVLN